MLYLLALCSAAYSSFRGVWFLFSFFPILVLWFYIAHWKNTEGVKNRTCGDKLGINVSLWCLFVACWRYGSYSLDSSGGGCIAPHSHMLDVLLTAALILYLQPVVETLFSWYHQNFPADALEELPWILQPPHPAAVITLSDWLCISKRTLPGPAAPLLCAGWCMSCRFRIGAHSRLSFTGCSWIPHFLFHDGVSLGKKAK